MCIRDRAYSLSLVTPGVSSTMDRRFPAILLKSIDLPTFGRPTIAISGLLLITLSSFTLSPGKRQGQVSAVLFYNTHRDIKSLFYILNRRIVKKYSLAMPKHISGYQHPPGWFYLVQRLYDISSRQKPCLLYTSRCV